MPTEYEPQYLPLTPVETRALCEDAFAYADIYCVAPDSKIRVYRAIEAVVPYKEGWVLVRDAGGSIPFKMSTDYFKNYEKAAPVGRIPAHASRLKTLEFV